MRSKVLGAFTLAVALLMTAPACSVFDSKVPNYEPPPSSAAPRQPHTPHASQRSAVLGTVARYFRLAEAGRFKASCALQTRKYSAYDRHDGDHDGGCEQEQRKARAQFHALGAAVKAQKVRIWSLSGPSAKVEAIFAISNQKVSVTMYLRYAHGAWRISGDEYSGDLG